MSKKYVSKELAKEIHARASPFIRWLKEAEEESEGSEVEEEEDDENVEVLVRLSPDFTAFPVIYCLRWATRICLVKIAANARPTVM